MSAAKTPSTSSAGDAKARLRLWIRMLRLTRTIESELRENLRTEFGATLPRFDVMAALHRFPGGMILSELSRYLMVSNGNVTGIVNRLVNDGLVERTLRDGDRRTSVVRLSERGVRNFERMMECLSDCARTPEPAVHLRTLREAALADPEGGKLRAAVAALRAEVVPSGVG